MFLEGGFETPALASPTAHTWRFTTQVFVLRGCQGSDSLGTIVDFCWFSVLSSETKMEQGSFLATLIFSTGHLIQFTHCMIEHGWQDNSS